MVFWREGDGAVEEGEGFFVDEVVGAKEGETDGVVSRGVERGCYAGGGGAAWGDGLVGVVLGAADVYGEVWGRGVGKGPFPDFEAEFAGEGHEGGGFPGGEAHGWGW